MVDRSIALIHIYARGGTQLGRFVYFTNAGKEKLFYGYRKPKQESIKPFILLEELSQMF